MELNGIDVSYHNGEIDWVKVKNSGVDFAILRCGFGRENPNQIDKQFERNYREAKAVGIPVGVYHYSYATTPQMAKKEAEFCLKLIKGKQFEYPIYFDIEEKRQAELTKQQCTDIVIAFCSELEKAGYWAGVYSYDSFFTSNLDEGIQKRYTCWVARVENIKPTYCKEYDVWQNSWKGKINGITGNNGDVDTNICYRNFPAVIKKAKKNNFNIEVAEPDKYLLTAKYSDLCLEEITNITEKLKDIQQNVVITKKKL